MNTEWTLSVDFTSMKLCGPYRKDVASYKLLSWKVACNIMFTFIAGKDSIPCKQAVLRALSTRKCMTSFEGRMPLMLVDDGCQKQDKTGKSRVCICYKILYYLINNIVEKQSS